MPISKPEIFLIVVSISAMANDPLPKGLSIRIPQSAFRNGVMRECPVFSQVRYYPPLFEACQHDIWQAERYRFANTGGQIPDADDALRNIDRQAITFIQVRRVALNRNQPVVDRVTEEGAREALGQ